MNNKNKFVIENGVLVKYPGAGIEEAFLDEPISIKDDAGEITSVIIPEGVTSIGEDTFWECDSLTSVIIPEGVTSIGERAFCGCTGLTSIDLPNSLSVISSWAFSGCKGLKSLTIPCGVTEINGVAFSGCSGLTSIEVSDDNKAYYSENNCIIERGSKKLVLGCKNSIIPDDITEIAISAFEGCTELASVVIPDSVTKIGGSAFSHCTGLKSIVIPDSVTDIGMYAFGDCSSLTSIVFGKNVRFISAFEMFYGCTGLASIEIKDGNERYYSQNNCVIERATKKLVLGCKNSIIPDDVTAIGKHAFDGCIELKSIVIPESVTKIETYSFRGCKGLETVVIPKSVTEIGSATYWGGLGGAAFCDCTGLTSVVISKGVTKIGYGTFEGCTGLASVVIPEGVTEIGDRTFGECIALESVALPKSLKKIGSCVFRNSGVGTVTYAGTRSEFNAIERTEWNRESKIATVVCLGGEDVEISEHDQWLELITQDDAQELENAPEHILADKDFMIKAVKRNGFTLKYASDELKNDAEVVLAAINGGDEWGCSAKALEFASDELKDDKSIVMTAVSRHSEALCFASDRLRCDRDVVMAAVDQSGWALEYASDELRNDEEVVLTAIQGWDGVSCNYSFAIKHASEELKSNKEFMIKAIELTEGEAFAKASDALKNDKEIVLIAVKNCSPPHQCDPTIVLAYASDQMRADKDIVLAAVRRNGWSLNYASEELKADKDVVLVATINNPWSLTYASPALRADKEFMMYVVKAAGADPLEYASAEIRNDPDILKAAEGYVPLSEHCGFEYYGLNKIIIPATVTDFDRWEFFNHTRKRNDLEGITVEEGHPLYHSAGNCLIETESKTLILGCKNSVIPDDGSVEKISARAFSYCNGLKSIHIPASVTEISDKLYYSSFEFCNNLERVTVSPDNKHIYSINDEILISNSSVAFVSKNVKSFHFTADMNGFIEGAFSACRDLESLTVDPDNPWLYSINNCVIEKEYNTILIGCKNSIIPDDRPISIAPCAFMGVELKNIYLPANVEYVDFEGGEPPFSGCIGIESITVADGNEKYHSINNCLMKGDLLLRGSNNSVIPDDGSVCGFEYKAFADCTGLINITIPSTMVEIEVFAFKNCVSLTTVVLSNNVGMISAGAFENCNRLSSIFYLGTQEERNNNLWIENQNDPIALATWYYYSEEKPEEEGNYWHYVDGEPTVW